MPLCKKKKRLFIPLWIGTRSKTLCKEAVKAFVVKQSRVSMLELDLASFDSVYKFASEVKLELSERKIDVLISKRSSYKRKG